MPQAVTRFLAKTRSLAVTRFLAVTRSLYSGHPLCWRFPAFTLVLRFMRMLRTYVLCTCVLRTHVCCRIIVLDLNFFSYGHHKGDSDLVL